MADIIPASLTSYTIIIDHDFGTVEITTARDDEVVGMAYSDLPEHVTGAVDFAARSIIAQATEELSQYGDGQ